MRKLIKNIKKGLKITGFLLTWPIAQLYRGIRFLYEIELGTLLTGISFILCVGCGIADYINGATIKEILLLYGIIYMILAGLGSWSVTMFLSILMGIFRPIYRLNQKCRWWSYEISKIKKNQEHPLDEFIKANQYVKSYQMRPIK